MLEIKKNEDTIVITNSDKVEITIDTASHNATIDEFDINFPWEYEKWWILSEVQEFDWTLYYNFVTEWKYISFVSKESFELKSDLQKFLNHIDILIINWSKENAKNFENIESKVVVPYGEGKHTFFTTLWQNPEEQKTLKIKGDISGENIDYINLI